MKFDLYRTSGDPIYEEQAPGRVVVREKLGPYEWARYTIEISDLDQLKSLVHSTGEQMIVSFDPNKIEIYDDYRE